MKGFTLIELLVVVLIIGILAAVALPQYNRVVAKSRYVQAMTSADAIVKGAELYKMANGVYPATLEDLDITLPGTLDEDKTYITVNDYGCHYYMGKHTTDSVHCGRGDEMDSQYVGYRIFLGGVKDGQRFCLARKGNQTAANLCVSLGGKNPYDNGTGLMHYQL